MGLSLLYRFTGLDIGSIASSGILGFGLAATLVAHTLESVYSYYIATHMKFPVSVRMKWVARTIAYGAFFVLRIRQLSNVKGTLKTKAA